MLTDILVITLLIDILVIISLLIKAEKNLNSNVKADVQNKSETNNYRFMKDKFSHLAFEARKKNDYEMMNIYIKYYNKYDKLERGKK